MFPTEIPIASFYMISVKMLTGAEKFQENIKKCKSLSVKTVKGKLEYLVVCG